MAKGKKAILIREGDSLIGVDLTDDNSDILLAARKGKANRFRTDSLRAMGRVSSGVRGMRLSADNEVVGLVTMSPESDNTLLVVSEKGYGKRSTLESYRLTSRGSIGVKTINVTERTGELIAFESVNDDNDLVIINRSGMLIRIRVADIKIAGRATQGVRLINLEKRGDEIASVCAVPTDPEEATETVDGEELPELDFNQNNEPDEDVEIDDVDDDVEITDSDDND